jgi:hypothetical protein
MLNPNHPVTALLKEDRSNYEVVRPLAQAVNLDQDALHTDLPVQRASIHETTPGVTGSPNPDLLSFHLRAFGKDFHVELRKNTELFAPNYDSARFRFALPSLFFFSLRTFSLDNVRFSSLAPLQNGLGRDDLKLYPRTCFLH